MFPSLPSLLAKYRAYSHLHRKGNLSKIYILPSFNICQSEKMVCAGMKFIQMSQFLAVLAALYLTLVSG